METLPSGGWAHLPLISSPSHSCLLSSLHLAAAASRLFRSLPRPPVPMPPPVVTTSPSETKVQGARSARPNPSAQRQHDSSRRRRAVASGSTAPPPLQQQRHRPWFLDSCGLRSTWCLIKVGYRGIVLDLTI